MSVRIPRREAGGTRRDALGAVLAGLVVLAAACGGDAGADEAAGSGDGPGSEGYARVINVEVAPVTARTFTERIRLTGTVEANRDIRVPAEEDGTVRGLLAEEGSRVRGGQPIAKLDDELLRHQLAQAEAQADVARETFERNRHLYEEEKAISELRFLEVRARDREAAARRDLLAERLARTTVRAPFSGVLETHFVELGERLGVGDPVARLVELNPVKVTAGVPERYAADVRVGTRATVTFDVLPGRSFEGELTYVGSTIDRESRTFSVEFRVPNPDGAIKPEMVATVTLVRRTLEDAVVVPQEALVRAEAGFVAFVVEQGEGERPAARVRELTLGPTQRNEAVVAEGLSPGDRLIVVGQKQVADGDRVRIVAEHPPTAAPDGMPADPGGAPDLPVGGAEAPESGGRGGAR